MFGLKRHQKAKAIAPLLSCAKVYELLNGLNFEGISPQEVKPGLLSFLKRVFRHAHAWTRGESAVAAATLTMAVAMVVAMVVEVDAAAVVVAMVAFAAMAFAAMAVAAVVAAAKEKGRVNLILFYAFFLECVALTVMLPFIFGLSVFPPLAAVLALLGCYLWNGIRGALGIKPKPEALPQTVSELHRFVERKIKETVQKYRSRALNADSEFAKRLTDAEKSLEKTQTLIARMKGMLAAGEDEEYILPRLKVVEDTAAEIEQSHGELISSKSELLEKLNLFEAHLPMFEKIFSRLSLDEEIASISDKNLGLREETLAFIEREMESFRHSFRTLVSALEETCYLTIGDHAVAFPEIENSAKLIEETSYRAARMLEGKN